MSARLLKKVLEKNERSKSLQEITSQREDEEEDDESAESDTGRVINPFTFLDDDESNKEEEDSDELVSEKDEDGANTGVSHEVEPLSASSQKVKKNKKKKKKNKSNVFSAEVNVLEDEVVEGAENLSIDGNASRTQKLPIDSDSKQDGDGKVKAMPSSVLQIDPRSLNPENELKKIFGVKVVKSFDRSRHASNSPHTRGGRRRLHSTRRTLLVSAMEHWPRWEGSLSMEFLETKDRFHYFRYVRSSSYEQAQRSYEAAKAIHDLNGIAANLVRHPYHIESLVAMAEYFQFVGDHQTCADAIAKSLYALECAWHPMFTPLQGNSRLKIAHEANKPFFRVLFSHMRNLDRRGCHRSALEVCKLLLSLDDDDPMGAVFCIDYFALRSEQYQWLEEFAEVYHRDSSLWLFPNFSFSLAVCRMNLEQKEASNGEGVRNTRASSKELMMQALMLHPYVLRRLVAKVPLKDRAWTDILSHSIFRSEKVGSPSLDHLVSIYVERSYMIWRFPDLQKLLREAAMEVIATLQRNSAEAKDWACARTEAFSSHTNEYGHLLVSDFSDTVPTLPPENLQNFVVNPQMGEADLDGNGVDHVARGAVPPPLLADRNPIAVLFESLLPWANYAPPQNDDANGN